MKITIDTKEDSHEDIKKVIKMLQHLVGEESYTNQPNIFEDSSTPTETGNEFASMFGNSSIEHKEEPMDDEKKRSKDIPQVIPY